MSARRRWLRRRVPAQSTRRARWRILAAREQLNRAGLKNRRSAAQHAFGEAGDIDGRSEQSSMAAHAAHYVGIIVIDFALNYSAAECAIVRCRRYHQSCLRRGGEACAPHAERSKHFLTNESVERFACQSLQHLTQQNEPNVAVDSL